MYVTKSPIIIHLPTHHKVGQLLEHTLRWLLYTGIYSSREFSNVLLTGSLFMSLFYYMVT